MEFRTQVKQEKALFTFSHADSILLMGSCFAENIGEKLTNHFFPVDINPFGTLYNPASVASGLRMLIDSQSLKPSDLFCHEGVYHSLQQINDRLNSSSAVLKMADRLVVTFGTAWVYKLKTNGSIVANCHKLPDKLFSRTRLTVSDIVSEWTDLLNLLLARNPNLKILFTVSPVRHWKDGANGNQLSKATLLLSIDELRRLFPDCVDYFPAYEIIMDELRDYRFYADDMLHPSSLAVEYIWKSFSEQFLSSESFALLKDLAEVQKAINHRPFNPESEAYHSFIKQTLRKAEDINDRLGRGQLLALIAELKGKIT